MRGARRCLWAVLAVSLATPPVAWASHVRWTIVPDESRIVFEYLRNGQPQEGIFGSFAGHGTFHPEAPDEATFEIEIESGSIDLGDAKASAFATSAEWFDARNHPEVVYRLRKLTPLGSGSYRAEGDLSIRGKTRPVTTTLTLDINGQEAHASGTLEIERKDYLLGVGPLSLFVNIGPDVAVRFDLTAHPAR